jgi:mRNA interferase MazF
VSRQRRPLIQRGDIWDADIPGVGVHPVVVVTRETAIPVLSSLLCVLITSSFHGHVAEVSVGQRHGLDHDSAANCDNIFTLPRQVLTRRRSHLDTAKLAELDAALTIALGLD